MNGVDQQIRLRFDGDFRIQTVMQQQPQHGAQNQGRQTRIIGPGSVRNEHFRTKVGFFVFSLLVRIYLNNIKYFHFFVRSLSMAPIRSIGSGKTMVLLLSEAISVNVCR